MAVSHASLLSQLQAVQQARWRMVVHSLRSARGKLEFGSKILVTLFFLIAGCGLGIGAGFTSWSLVVGGRFTWLGAVLWGILLLRQVLPLLMNAAAESFDLGTLLRLPLSYPAYALIRSSFGILDRGSILSGMATLGMLTGISVARPRLAPWAAVILSAFWLFNTLAERALSTWVDRWMAQRRSRELLGAFAFLLLLLTQLIGPVAGRIHGPAAQALRAVALRLRPLEQALPPGLAALALDGAARRNAAAAVAFTLALLLYGLALAFILHLRLRKEYAGEFLGNSLGVPSSRIRHNPQNQPSGDAARVNFPLAAVFLKDCLYLVRSGPLLFTLITPLFLLGVFASGGQGVLHTEITGRYGFTIGCGYVLMIMTNLLYNTLGADAAGVQAYFILPVQMRTVLLAKNLLHAAIVVIEMGAVWLIVSLLRQTPSAPVAVWTMVWMSAALLLNLAAGNVMSLLYPKKAEVSRFGRQKPAAASVFLSLAVQAICAGIAIGAFALGRTSTHSEVTGAILVLALFAAAAAYVAVLGRVDAMALAHRDELASAFVRSQ